MSRGHTQALVRPVESSINDLPLAGGFVVVSQNQIIESHRPAAATSSSEYFTVTVTSRENMMISLPSASTTPKVKQVLPIWKPLGALVAAGGDAGSMLTVPHPTASAGT